MLVYICVYACVLLIYVDLFITPKKHYWTIRLLMTEQKNPQTIQCVRFVRKYSADLCYHGYNNTIVCVCVCFERLSWISNRCHRFTGKNTRTIVSTLRISPQKMCFKKKYVVRPLQPGDFIKIDNKIVCSDDWEREKEDVKSEKCRVWRAEVVIFDQCRYLNSIERQKTQKKSETKIDKSKIRSVLTIRQFIHAIWQHQWTNSTGAHICKCASIASA